MFFLVGVVYERAHTRDLNELGGGIWQLAPVYGGELGVGLQQLHAGDSLERKQAGESLAEEWVGDGFIEKCAAVGEVLGVDLIELDAVGGEANAAVAEVGYVEGTGSADLAGDGEVPLLDVAIGLVAEDDVGVGAEAEGAVVDAASGTGADDAVGKGIGERGFGRVIGVENIGDDVVVKRCCDDCCFEAYWKIEDAVAAADGGFVVKAVGEAGCASNLWAKVAFPFFWAII